MDAGLRDEMLRAARNQSLYREVNERIEELNERFEAAVEAGATWLCECADPQCSEPMSLTLGEYEELRSHPDHFAVLPGHVLEAVERVVDSHDGYVVVEKFGPAAAYAAELDPRKEEPRGNGHVSEMAHDHSAPSASKPKLVFFHSPTSGRCRRVEGFIAQVLQHRSNHDTFDVVRVSVEERPDLAERFGVETLPTLCVVEGRRLRKRITPRGCRELERELAAWLN